MGFLHYKMAKNEAVIALAPEGKVICLSIISSRGEHCRQFLWQRGAACISFKDFYSFTLLTVLLRLWTGSSPISARK